MLVLKEYQKRALNALEQYFSECVRLKDADTAFYESTRRAYNPIQELPGLPLSMCMLHGVTMLHVDAMPTCGFLKSSRVNPTAYSIARLAARSMGSVI